ncbi:MAG: hypothetical protein C0501_08500 [Isosphaera sp.]|nr:hypothetical protein [Isosphaera sp.]
MGLAGRVRRLARAAARRVARPTRVVLVRLLRPLVAGFEGQLQRLYDRQAEDRARLFELERLVADLRRQSSRAA